MRWGLDKEKIQLDDDEILKEKERRGEEKRQRKRLVVKEMRWG